MPHADRKNPRVIGCGQVKIRTKRGNEFPTFLVFLPGRDECRWRTKRDFLLVSVGNIFINTTLQQFSTQTQCIICILNATTKLNRSLTQCQRPSLTFPKKAFAKLSNKATWVRPDDDEAPVGGYCELVDRHSHPLESRGSCNNSNNFDPTMKKSLYQLDCFLVACYSASKPTSDEEKDKTQNTTSIAEAWSVFCRQEDTNDVVLSSSSKNASSLGQFFASEENAKSVSTSLLLLPSEFTYEWLLRTLLYPGRKHCALIIVKYEEPQW